jgi:hypothetical protein
MKTKKLVCIITGRSLNAVAEYYTKKLEKAGSEEELKRTYICREAKELLEKGFSVVQIRKQFNAEDITTVVPEDVIKELTTNEFGMKKNTLFSGISSFTHQETDPEVKDFINKIYAGT